jgi:hypothetical protein
MDALCSNKNGSNRNTIQFMVITVLFLSGALTPNISAVKMVETSPLLLLLQYAQ